ncbi:MAG: DNA internalization-related competence protein ComEC/Rec2 [bacterium]
MESRGNPAVFDKPIILFALLYIGGIILGAYLPLPHPFVGVGIALTSIISIALFSFRFHTPTNLGIYISIVLLGWWGYRAAVEVRPPHHISNVALGQEANLIGTVVRKPDVRSDRTYLVVDAEEVDLKRAEGLVRVAVYDVSVSFDYGQRLLIRGRLRKPREMRNPGDFDYASFLARRGIYATVSAYDAGDIVVMGYGEVNPLIRFSLAIRERIEELVDFAMPVDLQDRALKLMGLSRFSDHLMKGTLRGQRGVLKGILIGDIEELPRDINEIFTDTGTVHILVVSGSNVALVTLIVFFVLRKLLRLPQRVTSILSMGFVVIYTVLTGAEPPVVRAAAMSLIILFLLAVGRDPHIYSVLALAVLGMLLVNPPTLFDVSFQLSVGATLGVIYFTPIIQGLFEALLSKLRSAAIKKILRGVLLIFSASIGAQIVTTPIIAAGFHRLSLVAPFANIPIVFLAELLLPLGAAMVGAGLLSGVPLLGPALASLAKAVGIAIWALISLMLILARWFSRIPFSSMDVPSLPAALVFYFYIASFLLANFNSIRWAKRAFVHASLVFASAFVWWSLLVGGFPGSGVLEMTVLDVGRGSSVFFRFPNGRNMLVDGGGVAGSSYDIGEGVILPFLQRKWIRGVDTVVLTNPHYDHLGGLLTILRRLPVGRVIDGAQRYEAEPYRHFLGEILRRGVNYSIARAGDRFREGDVLISILNPPSLHRGDVEDDAVVLKLSYGKTRILLAGDLGPEAEEALAASGARLLECDILKMGRHGEAPGATELFLRVANPRVVVFSLGERDRGKFPSLGVLETCQDIRASVYSTYENGAIVVRTDGRGYKIRSMVTQRN